MQKDQIIVAYGSDIGDMVVQLCDTAGLSSMVDPGMEICLKPNLVVAKPSSTGATTSPEIVDALTAYLFEAGCRNITICESSWVGDNTARAFKTCGYKTIAKKFGIELIDAASTKTTVVETGGMHLEVSRSFLETDFLINLPVVKGHCQTKMTCALKNLKGCIPDTEKRRYHTLGIHKPVANLNTVITQHFIIADAIQGDLTFEEGGTPVRMDRLIAALDPVLLDSYAAGLMGLRPEEVEYIRLAETLGVGTTDLSSAEIIELGEDKKRAVLGGPSDAVRRLTKNVTENQACSACYGNLVHALSRFEQTGITDRLPPLHIGQGYKNTKADGIGIGSCTGDFSVYIRGCPPSALVIKEFLESQLK